MTREELIEQEAFEVYPIAIIEDYDVNEEMRDIWLAGINSQLAKDLQELVVIEGKIKAYNDVMDNLLNKEDLISNAELRFHIVELETQRTELLKRLNL